jgi:hypothetical protein
MALYLGPLHAVPILAFGTSLAFLLGAAWRLARFPIVKRDDCFLGMMWVLDQGDAEGAPRLRLGHWLAVVLRLAGKRDDGPIRAFALSQVGLDGVKVLDAALPVTTMAPLAADLIERDDLVWK